MNTTKEFNDKYKNYLKDRFYGLAIHNKDVINYLDKEFEKEIKANPDFSYQQIKTKFDFVCVYAESEKNREWETEIMKLLKKNEST